MLVKQGIFAGIVLHSYDLQWLERTYNEYQNTCAELHKIGYSNISNRNELAIRKKQKRDAIERFFQTHGNDDFCYTERVKRILAKLFPDEG